MFVFGTNIKVVSNPSEETKEFVGAVSDFMGIIDQIQTEIPFYKFYNNKFSKRFVKAVEVSQKKLMGICQ